MTDIHTEDRVATLHASMDDCAKLIGQQRQTISELREALKPFAKEAAAWDDAFDPPPEDEPMWIGCRKNRFMTDEAAFTLGDLRKARHALKTGEAK